MPLSPAVDAYIESAPAYAQPILRRLRELFHKACHEVEETLKWNVPHFDYKGVVAGVSAHKRHINLIFWKASIMADPERLFPGGTASAMNPIRITSAADMPSDKVLLSYIREAIKLNEDGAKLPARKRSAPKNEPPVPPELAAALKSSEPARAAFEAFRPSHRREYIVWIADAKRPETRARRAAQAIEWIAKGSTRNWMYEQRR